MNKEMIRERITAESFNDITKDLPWRSGQDCVIMKAECLQPDNPNDIVYIKDLSLSDVRCDTPINYATYDPDWGNAEYEVEELLSNCYTMNDFLRIAHGVLWIAELLFSYVDWQTPSLDDYFDTINDREHAISIYGEPRVLEAENAGIHFGHEDDPFQLWYSAKK